MSLMFLKRYNKNYNNRMSIEEVLMNMTNRCHMNLLSILCFKNTYGANENLDLGFVQPNVH